MHHVTLKYEMLAYEQVQPEIIYSYTTYSMYVNSAEQEISDFIIVEFLHALLSLGLTNFRLFSIASRTCNPLFTETRIQFICFPITITRHPCDKARMTLLEGLDEVLTDYFPIR